MKKVLYVIIAILLAIIIFFCVVLVTVNTQNRLIKQTEEVAKQATETSLDSAYITTADHLAEIANSNKALSSMKTLTGSKSSGATEYTTFSLTFTVPFKTNHNIMIVESMAQLYYSPYAGAIVKVNGKQISPVFSSGHVSVWEITADKNASVYIQNSYTTSFNNRVITYKLFY
jgi:predicted PurR-regulated permease PerM